MATDGRPTARCATEKARNGDAVKTRFAPRRRDGAGRCRRVYSSSVVQGCVAALILLVI